jgi:hypothetical protein
MPSYRSSLVLSSLVVLLMGCAARQPVLQPGDLPVHATEPPFVLHWRIDQEAGSATAVGVVEVGAPDRILSVTLELQGIDQDGRLVSRGRGWAYARSFTGVEPWPFTASVRPSGREARFRVTVVDVTWRAQQMSR